MPSSSSQLWQQIANYVVIAIVGLSKNCGKTVTLNHLLRLAEVNNCTVGLSSIGRDGEAFDEVFRQPKPAITVAAGTLVATARKTLSHAQLSYQILAESGISSAMGDIVIIRASSCGKIEVAGASSAAGQRKIIAQLKSLGAAKIFIDGALGRKQHAASNLADSIILATGAAIAATGNTMHDVLTKTRNIVEILSINAADTDNLALATNFFASAANANARSFALYSPQRRLLYFEHSNSFKLQQYLNNYLVTNHAEPLVYLVFNGVIGEQLWSIVCKIAKLYQGFTLLLNDATQLFIERNSLRSFGDLAGKIYVCSPLRLSAICINPYSPYSNSSYPAKDFLSAAQTTFSEYFVCDVMLEET